MQVLPAVNFDFSTVLEPFFALLKIFFDISYFVFMVIIPPTKKTVFCVAIAIWLSTANNSHIVQTVELINYLCA